MSFVRHVLLLYKSEITTQKYKSLTRTRRQVLGDELRLHASAATSSYHRSKVRYIILLRIILLLEYNLINICSNLNSINILLYEIQYKNYDNKLRNTFDILFIRVR